jgi:organic hydroperoxide reductase OsmC/OhrA
MNRELRAAFSRIREILIKASVSCLQFIFSFMIINASIKNSSQQNDVTVDTDGKKKTIRIPARKNGQGSSVNGGELLFLALATCFCNDLYREAVRREIKIESVEVTVSGVFGGEGEPASDITYKAHIQSDASKNDIEALVAHVDKVAEIHNTVRRGVNVSLVIAV